MPRVYGTNYPTRDVSENTSLRFRETRSEFSIGLLHANVGNNTGPGHPYLNSVEEVWKVLKAAVDNSVRYADLKTHPDAVYKFIDHDHHFDFDFATFWRRKQSKGIMRPFIRMEGKIRTSISERKIATLKKKNA